MTKKEIEMYINGMENAIIGLGYYMTPYDFDKAVLVIIRKAMNFFNDKLNADDITKNVYYEALHLLNKSAVKYLSK